MKVIARLLLGTLLVLSTGALAEMQYPTKPIRLIVLNPPGGGQDFVMRVLASKLNERFGYSIFIDNQPKALGEIGKKNCADSPPDGYTICSVADGIAALQPAFYAAAKEGIPVDNLTPIQIVADQYFSFVVRKDHPDTFMAFIDFARKNPDKFVCGSGSTSTTGRLGMAILNGLPGVKIREAFYSDGEPGALRDIRAGTIDCMFASMTSALPHLEDGAIKALGTFGPLKNPFLPDVLPLAQIGYPAFGTLGSWYALWGPPDMPKQLVEFLNRDINMVLEDEEMRNVLARNGVSVRRRSSSEQLASETRGLFRAALELICKEKIEFNGRICKKD